MKKSHYLPNVLDNSFVLKGKPKSENHSKSRRNETGGRTHGYTEQSKTFTGTKSWTKDKGKRKLRTC